QINSYFSDGHSIEDTINDLVSGKLKPQNLLNIRVTLNENNQFISAYNRSLYCYQQAIQKGTKFTNIPVKIVREIDGKAGFN
ncbi:2356_t:CDS:1, partial [Gigaspora margarita]